MKPPSIHPAEWVFAGMALMGLLWALADVVGVATRKPMPTCAVPLPATEIRSTDRPEGLSHA